MNLPRIPLSALPKPVRIAISVLATVVVLLPYVVDGVDVDGECPPAPAAEVAP